VNVSSQDVTIPAGTVFSSVDSRTTYVSQDQAIITAGNATADVSVIAADAGVVGNVQDGALFSASPGITNFASASNLVALSNGRDLESDDERKQRFLDYVQTLQRGTNAALTYGAKTVAIFNGAGIETERVKFANTIEPYILDNTQPIAWVQLFVHNGKGSTSGGIVTQVASVIQGYVDANGNKVPGWKAAGVKVDVAAATEINVNLIGLLTASPGFDQLALADAAEAAVDDYLLDLDIGETAQIADIVSAVCSIEGVDNFVVVAADPATMWGTSTTSKASTATGSQTWATQAGLGFAANQVVQLFRTSNPTSRFIATVSSYSGTSLTVNILSYSGAAGTYTDWTIAPLDVDDIGVSQSQKAMPGAVNVS